MSMISLSGIDKIYRTKEVETQALENVNMEVEKGEFLSVMGPSGCGKSTLLNIIGLLDTPTHGKVILNGTVTVGMNDRTLAAFRNREIGFIFQSFHLIQSLNVIDNVEVPLLYRNISAKDRHQMAKTVLEKVGLSHRQHHMPSELSGGQCQRVAIARAIVGNPEIILADEPTGNLDSKMGAEIMDILHHLNKDEGRTIVMVTHNEEQAKQTSRIVRFFDGRQIQ
jgi:putative ABC transport system ATP-binding protein